MKNVKKQNDGSNIVRRLIASVIALMLFMSISITVVCSGDIYQSNDEKEIAVVSEDALKFDMDIDYTSLILECAAERTEESFLQAKEYERLRNLKIEYMQISNYETTTNYFSTYSSWDEIFESNVLSRFGLVKEYDENTDYASFIEEALKDPINTTFDHVKEYERLNNQKIEFTVGRNGTMTEYFVNYSSWDELFMSGTMDNYYIDKNYEYAVYASNLNLRSGPGTTYDKVDTLDANEVIVFLGAFINEDDEIWYRVSYNGTVSYAYSKYLKVYDDTYEKYVAVSNSGTGGTTHGTGTYVPNGSTITTYTEDDVYWLAVAITMEGGCSWYPEYLRNYIGCVVLNRVESSRYANSIYDVLHQPGQYPWAGGWHKEPYEWCITTARDLLNGNRMLPNNIVYQASFRQGTFTHAEYYDDVLGSWFYFCGI